MEMKNIKHVVQVCTNNTLNFNDEINDYLQKGYRLVHVGTLTDEDTEGRPFHGVIAILGSETIP